MKTLSWMFFCISPFALFCSEHGNGLVLCPIFIILGFLFKWIGENYNSTPTAVVKVKPNEFWEWHYKNRMRDTLNNKETINDGLMALRDKEARSWATTICGYHNAWVPPKDEQERIARANGVVTEAMIEEESQAWNRLQVGKYFLMQKLKEKYKGKSYGNGDWYTKNYRHELIIEDACKALRLYNRNSISSYSILSDYGMNEEAVWNTVLSDTEKTNAQKWVDEYENRLLKEIDDFVNNGVNMPTIKKHNAAIYGNLELNIKYGFVK